MTTEQRKERLIVAFREAIQYPYPEVDERLIARWSSCLTDEEVEECQAIATAEVLTGYTEEGS